MGMIWNAEALFKFVKDVGKSETPAFDQQAHAFQLFMFSRRYRDAEIDEYLQNGLLPRLMAYAFPFYLELLSTIRQLAFDHSDLWENRDPHRPCSASTQTSS
jgi:hypothetical protein